MKYNRRIKNKNIGYFIVKGKVFNSLHQAEEYCRENNLDLNDEILSENDDILKQAKVISRNNLPLLYSIKEYQYKQIAEESQVYDKRVKEYKESLKCRDLDRELKHRYMIEQLGVMHGMQKMRGLIQSEIEVMESILRIPGGN